MYSGDFPYRDNMPHARGSYVQAGSINDQCARNVYQLNPPCMPQSQIYNQSTNALMYSPVPRAGKYRIDETATGMETTQNVKHFSLGTMKPKEAHFNANQGVPVPKRYPNIAARGDYDPNVIEQKYHRTYHMENSDLKVAEPYVEQCSHGASSSC